MKVIGKKVLAFEELGSTNDEAKRIAHLEEDGTVITTKLQTNGRGRMGRAWSDSSSNIAMSIILKPDLELYLASQITLLAGIAVSRVVENSKIKWPNDVIIGSKKVCGILTESVDGNSLIVGIGINVNNESFQEDLREKATSLFLETGKKYSRTEIIEKIITEFDDMYKIFKKQGISQFIAEYKSLCVNIGRDVVVLYSSREVKGIAVDISPSGELIVKAEDGMVEKISSGEVSVRGLYGYI